MFTGLVQTVGEIVEIRPLTQQKQFVIRSDLDQASTVLGASVSVNGVCLTVTETRRSLFKVDVGFETLARTTLGTWKRGERVNLEPSLRIGDALGGHFVSGHVDDIGQIKNITQRGNAKEIWITTPSPLLPLIAEKGSICVDGVSLTINQVRKDEFMIGIIPHTLSQTTLGTLRVGTKVNIEADMLARYVARLVAVQNKALVHYEIA